MNASVQAANCGVTALVGKRSKERERERGGGGTERGLTKGDVRDRSLPIKSCVPNSW